jgi:hypothetical protein
VERVMAMRSEGEYVIVVMKFEEQVMVSRAWMNVYRSFWSLCPEKLYPKRTEHSCRHCPFYADSAVNEGLADVIEKLKTK